MKACSVYYYTIITIKYWLLQLHALKNKTIRIYLHLKIKNIQHLTDLKL